MSISVGGEGEGALAGPPLTPLSMPPLYLYESRQSEKSDGDRGRMEEEAPWHTLEEEAPWHTLQQLAAGSEEGASASSTPRLRGWGGGSLAGSVASNNQGQDTHTHTHILACLEVWLKR